MGTTHPHVDEGVLDLIGDDGDAGLHNLAQVLRVKVCQGQVAYFALFSQSVHNLQRLDGFAHAVVVPPMELEKIQRGDLRLSAITKNACLVLKF